MEPKLIKGSHHEDERGVIKFNNAFNALGTKRVYTIQNSNVDFIRAWQGHKIEQRWLSAIYGAFKVKLIEVDNWDEPSKNLPTFEFILEAKNLDILHVPKGYVSSIQALEVHSILILLADFSLGEVDDEYRFPANYFN